MSLGVVWTVTAPALTKAQAGALAVEFWTSEGFEVSDSSYNRLIFRRRGYGTVSSWLEINVIGGSWSWTEVPIELTVLTQIMPSETKYTLQFRALAGVQEQNEGEYERFTEGWVDQFIAFINEWTDNGQRLLDQESM